MVLLRILPRLTGDIPTSITSLSSRKVTNRERNFARCCRRACLFCAVIIAFLPGCASRDEGEKVTAITQSFRSVSDASRVEHGGLVATIEQLTIKDNAVDILYQIQMLPSCSWWLKSKVTGTVRFYNANRQFINDEVRVSIELSVVRLQQGLPSQTSFTVDVPKDAFFVTVWYGVDEFETHLCPLPLPAA
jgi:hypothetical protein